MAQKIMELLGSNTESESNSLMFHKYLKSLEEFGNQNNYVSVLETYIQNLISEIFRINCEESELSKIVFLDPKKNQENAEKGINANKKLDGLKVKLALLIIHSSDTTFTLYLVNKIIMQRKKQILVPYSEFLETYWPLFNEWLKNNEIRLDEGNGVERMIQEFHENAQGNGGDMGVILKADDISRRVFRDFLLFFIFITSKKTP